MDFDERQIGSHALQAHRFVERRSAACNNVPGVLDRVMKLQGEERLILDDDDGEGFVMPPPADRGSRGTTIVNLVPGSAGDQESLELLCERGDQRRPERAFGLRAAHPDAVVRDAPIISPERHLHGPAPAVWKGVFGRLAGGSWPKANYDARPP